MLPAILAAALAASAGSAQPIAPSAASPEGERSRGARAAASTFAVPDLPAARPLPVGLWVAALSLAGLAAASFALTRRRTRRERMVEVVESTSIGPRRSLVVARLGDELLVLGSSEAGIALLTTSPAPLAARAARAADPAAASAPAAPGRGPGLLARLRLVAQRAPAPAFDSLLAESLEDLELRRKLASGRAGSVR